MGHHIDSKGRFQSDKYPDLEPDKIVVSFKDPRARKALFRLAEDCEDSDSELSWDVRERLSTIMYTDIEILFCCLTTGDSFLSKARCRKFSQAQL